MAVSTKGLDKVYAAYLKYPEQVKEKAVFELRKYGNKMQQHARQNHRFKSQGKSSSGYRRTGNAERSIQSEVKLKPFISLKFWINPEFVENNGFVYPWAQNDGTGYGYRRGEISPLAIPKLRSSGIKADDFMGRAYNKYGAPLMKALREIPKTVKKSIFREVAFIGRKLFGRNR
jgi:hypothetical protein